jgi:hypothetical protein
VKQVIEMGDTFFLWLRQDRATSEASAQVEKKRGRS